MGGEFVSPERFATGAGIAAFAMMNDFGGALQAAYFADASTTCRPILTRNLKFL